MSAQKEGSRHFLIQRITALALIPLVFWLCINIALLPDVSYETITTWLRSPFNAIMMVILIIISFQHAHLGLQVIFEDYISDVSKCNKVIIAVKVLSYILMTVGLYSIYTINFGGH